MTSFIFHITGKSYNSDESIKNKFHCCLVAAFMTAACVLRVRVIGRSCMISAPVRSAKGEALKNGCCAVSTSSAADN